MNFTTYKVTCKKCKKSDDIQISSANQILWKGNKHIISGRKRLDNEWGWECICTNNSILTKQEQKFITNKQEPDPKEIAEIVKNLKPEKPKFEMVSY